MVSDPASFRSLGSFLAQTTHLFPGLGRFRSEMLENVHSGMTDLKQKICFKHKKVRSKTHDAKYNKLNLMSIPLVAQVNLKKIINQLVFSAILKPPPIDCPSKSP